MLILPAIDLLQGACVRLAQGQFADVTAYGDPLEQLRTFAAAGARWVHVVDLDGARERRPVQHNLAQRLVRETNARIQWGGGVRERAHVAALLDAGIERVVLGSVALVKPGEVRDWMDEFGIDRLCCAFDVRPADNHAYEVVVNGWTADGGLSLFSALSLYPQESLRHALVTDVSRDGVLRGPNLELVREVVAARSDVRVQASGGVASLKDIAALRKTGAAAAIIGRALYEKRFPLEVALAG